MQKTPHFNVGMNAPHTTINETLKYMKYSTINDVEITNQHHNTPRDTRVEPVGDVNNG
jgi:dihydrodipicolinate reductase